MPVFTAIGAAIGLAGLAATAAGVATVAGVGALGYAAAGGFSGGGDTPVDSRVEAAAGTGQLTEAEAQTTAKKRAYRSGILHTSPTGLDADAKTSSAKLR